MSNYKLNAEFFLMNYHYSNPALERSRVKQDALARLYGPHIDHGAAKKYPSNVPLVSPLDPTPSPPLGSKSIPEISNRLSFVKKQHRTASERKIEVSIPKLHQELAEKVAQLKMQREVDSYATYVELVRKDKQRKEAEFRGKLAPEELVVDDTDIDNDELAKNEWELRELERIERDLSIVPQSAEDASEEPSTALAISTKEAPKTKYRFLQKYYHQGAFFADDSDTLLTRDYDLPTESDAVDKTALPEVLQVRNFGKRSQSKWKHLSAEDTTAFDGYGWYQKNDAFAESMATRMAGRESKKR